MNEDEKWQSGLLYDDPRSYIRPLRRSCKFCGSDPSYCGCEDRMRRERELERQRRNEAAELARIEKERAAKEAERRTFNDEELATSGAVRREGGQYGCPWCGTTRNGILLRKTGKYGTFYGCSRYPNCKFSFSPPGVDKPWQNKKTKKEDTMTPTGKSDTSKTTAVVTALKGEGKDAAWQVAANQTVKAATKTLGSVMKRKKMAKTKIAAVTKALDTDIGKAFFSFALGAAISASPLAEGTKMKRLARELRVKAMREGGDMIADIATDPTIELIQSIVSDLPDAE